MTSSGRPRLVGLLIAVVAAVLGVGGCSVLGLGGSTGGGSSSGAGNGKRIQLPENTNYQAGQAGPSPSPGAGVGGSPIRTPLAALPSVPVYTMTPSFNPSPVGTVCAGRLREGAVDGLDVTPLGGGRAEVRWMELGDPALQGYQLAAVSQKLVLGIQPPWKWVNVAKAGRCTQIRATVTGLVPGDPYIFVLHGVIKNYENVAPIVPEIGRSVAVRIT